LDLRHATTRVATTRELNPGMLQLAFGF